MKLVLIRHGKTEANEQHLYCGSTDISLSEAGISELYVLKSKISYPDATGLRVITSGMKRCEQTLSVLFGDIPHDKKPELCEMDFGLFEMRSYEQMKNEPDYIAWISGDNDSNTAPRGESGKTMTSRVLPAIEDIIKHENDSLIVTHGGPIVAIMTFLFADEQKNRYEWQPKPGCGYIISIMHGVYTYEKIG